MELSEATRQADMILDEERLHPTVNYEPAGKNSPILTDASLGLQLLGQADLERKFSGVCRRRRLRAKRKVWGIYTDSRTFLGPNEVNAIARRYGSVFRRNGIVPRSFSGCAQMGCLSSQTDGLSSDMSGLPPHDYRLNFESLQSFDSNTDTDNADNHQSRASKP